MIPPLAEIPPVNSRAAGLISIELKIPVNVFQKTLKHTRYGRISVKCYYDAPEQRLTVEILHAADIMALDANGKPAPSSGS